MNLFHLIVRSIKRWWFTRNDVNTITGTIILPTCMIVSKLWNFISKKAISINNRSKFMFLNQKQAWIFSIIKSCLLFSHLLVKITNKPLHRKQDTSVCIFVFVNWYFGINCIYCNQEVNVIQATNNVSLRFFWTYLYGNKYLCVSYLWDA